MTRIVIALSVAWLALLTIWGCDGGEPTRDHIPLLRKSLQRLEVAVQERDRAAIDSLLSIQILEHQQSSDSLLRMVYGSSGDFGFQRFGLGEITYTGSKARIDCFVMDTAQRRDRPITFTLVHEHDLWLLKRFEQGHSTY